jgi:hypothetical protein
MQDERGVGQGRQQQQGQRGEGELARGQGPVEPECLAIHGAKGVRSIGSGDIGVHSPPMAETTTDDQAIATDELVRLREENLRLRDLLISKDAELGALRGQVLALEAGTARLLNLVGRIRSLLPGPLVKALTSVLRRLLPRG